MNLHKTLYQWISNVSVLFLLLGSAAAYSDGCDDAKVWLNKGHEVPSDDFERREFYFEKANSLCPNSIEPKGILGWTYAFQGKFIKAMEIIEEGLDIDPFDWGLNYYKAHTSLLVGDFEQAVEYYDIAYKYAIGGRAQELILLELASSYWFQKEWGKSRETHFRLLELSGDRSSIANCSLAWVYAACAVPTHCDGELALNYAKKSICR